jgi:hypothetical protein
LRRVKFTATKLGLGSVEDWVEQELNGYQGRPPEYRLVHGTPMALNPIRGWMPMGGSVEKVNRVPNYEAVSALESLINSNETGVMRVRYPDRICEQFDQMNGVKGWNYALEIPSSELSRILDRVRTLVLDWALALERAGIMGSEANFNETEKEKAHAATTTINIGTIGNFAGNLGQGNVGGNASVKLDQAQQIVGQLKPHIGTLIEAGADAKLLDRMAELEEALKKPHADESQIRGLLTDVRNALSGAVGNLVASGAISALNILLGTGVPA